MLFPLEKPSFDVRFDSWEDPPDLAAFDDFMRKLRPMIVTPYVSEYKLSENLDKLARMIPDFPGYVGNPDEERELWKPARAKLKRIINKAIDASRNTLQTWRKLYAIYKALPTNGQAAAQRLFKGDINCLVESRKIAENGNDIPADVKRKIVEYETIISDCSKVTRTCLKNFYQEAINDPIYGQALIFKRP